MLWNLHALRGVACVMVVWFHLVPPAESMGATNPLFLVVRWFGFAGVDVFFVLSGFIMAYTNADCVGRPSKTPGYLFRRFWRIYPSYWAATAITSVVIVAFITMPGMSSSDLIHWLTLAPGSPPHLILPPAWSLHYEVAFYAVFGIALAFPRVIGNSLLAAWAAATLYCCFHSAPTIDSDIASPTIDHIAATILSPFAVEFLSGVVIAKVVLSGTHRAARFAPAVGISYFAIATIVAVQMYGDSESAYVAMIAANLPKRVLIFGVGSALIVYGLAGAEREGGRRCPIWFRQVGEASYSLYLIHPAVNIVSIWLWVWLGGTWPRIPWLMGTGAAAIGAGFLFYYLVEKPLLNLVRGKKSNAALRILPPPAIERRAA